MSEQANELPNNWGSEWAEAMGILGVTQPLADFYRESFTEADMESVCVALRGINRVEAMREAIAAALDRHKAASDATEESRAPASTPAVPAVDESVPAVDESVPAVDGQ